MKIVCLAVILALSGFEAVAQKSRVVPAIITNHYGESEPESHGVVTIRESDSTIRVEVKDLKSKREYSIVLLDEMTGERAAIGTLVTDRRGYGREEYSVKGRYPAFNAMLLMNGDDE